MLQKDHSLSDDSITDEQEVFGSPISQNDSSGDDIANTNHVYDVVDYSNSDDNNETILLEDEMAIEHDDDGADLFNSEHLRKRKPITLSDISSAEQCQFVILSRYSEAIYKDFKDTGCKYLDEFPLSLKTVYLRIDRFFSNLIRIQEYKFETLSFKETIPFISPDEVLTFWLTNWDTAQQIHLKNLSSESYCRLSRDEALRFHQNRIVVMSDPNYKFESMDTGSEWFQCLERSRSTWENRLLPGNNSLFICIYLL